MDSSTLRLLFLILAITGVLIPYAAFAPWLIEHGLNVPLLFKQAAANRVAAFAWLDVMVSATTLLLAAYSGRFVTLRQAVVVSVLTLLAGVSASLPMFLYFILGNTEKKDFLKSVNSQ